MLKSSPGAWSQWGENWCEERDESKGRGGLERKEGNIERGMEEGVWVGGKATGREVTGGRKETSWGRRQLWERRGLSLLYGLFRLKHRGTDGGRGEGITAARGGRKDVRGRAVGSVIARRRG